MERRSKYNARKLEIDGITFDSIAEAERYRELQLLQQAGEISDLECQPVFVLQPSFKVNGKTERAIKYYADFRYTENGGVVVEDVKGYKTKTYTIKRKMLLYRYHGIDFREVRK